MITIPTAIALPLLVAFVGSLAWIFTLKERIKIVESMNEQILTELRYIRERVDMLFGVPGQRS